MAGANIEFLGRLSDEELSGIYSRCCALIVTGEEDFGLTPLEANASGRPVTAYGSGGALETVVAGATGVFFYEQTVEALEKAVRDFDTGEFEPAKLRAHALKFDKEVFKVKVREYIAKRWAEHLNLSEG